MWHAQEYDPRQWEKPHAFPVDLSPDEKTRGNLKTYTVCVGDLCYVLVGQIVGRRLSAVRYQPTACIIINSPVASPALAAACHRDWQGLSPTDHERLLLPESMSDRYFFDALKRLCFYYPVIGKTEALRLLSEPDTDWNLGGRASLIKMLQPNPDPDFDAPIHEIFRRVDALPAPDFTEPPRIQSTLWERDVVASACSQRLILKGYDAEYSAYVEKRLLNPGLPNTDLLLAMKAALAAASPLTCDPTATRSSSVGVPRL
ncbi:MAG: hypothetical protein WC205_04350 [Opitutaceae bacterium]|jgi:hypothetical protein